MNWETLLCMPEGVQGVKIAGDPKVPATRWWNHLWFLWKGWKTIAVLEAEAEGSFRVGFRDSAGKVMLRAPMASRRFSVLVGREDVTFFAIDEDDNEVPLRCEDRKPRAWHNPALDGDLI